jgi:hypothetical protein
MQTLLLFWLIANLCIFAAWAAVWAREMLESGTHRSAMKAINNDREDLEALLPWHAAGTLSPRDAERVRKAVAADRELAQRFEIVREELNETILLNETLGAPSARAKEKLFATIDAEPPRRPQSSRHFINQLTVFMAGFSTRTLAWAGSAAALVLALELGVIVTMLGKNKSEHRTELASAGVTNASLAIIRFSPRANAADITKFLEVNNASVVDGPNSGGMYTIRLPTVGQEKNDLIKQMQTQSIVAFVATVQ